jgi:glutamate-5-semialdehyde dehydrogenase
VQPARHRGHRLALPKSGSACILRGGKEAINSNIVLASVVREAIAEAGVPPDAVQMVENTDRALLGELLKMRDAIDLMVPRGGVELIRYVAENATMPVLTGGIGVCHTYVDRAADIAKAVPVAHNAKTRKFSICNALDTLLVHTGIAGEFLPAIGRSWTEAGVEMHCDERSLRILKAQEIPEIKLTPAAPDDFGREFLALAAAVRTVDSLETPCASTATVPAIRTRSSRGLLRGDALPGRGGQRHGLRKREHAVHRRRPFGLGAGSSIPQKTIAQPSACVDLQVDRLRGSRRG